MDFAGSMVRPVYLWGLLAFTPLMAHGQRGGPVTPPEVKRTVDAFSGHWDLRGTAAEPSSKTRAAVTATFDCKRAALGVAIDCHITAVVSGAGNVEAAAVIGYSPDEHLVRWMEISSSGEYHDHKGSWKGNAIEFEPLPYSIRGERATEHLTVGFPSPGRMTLRSITETTAGESTLELAGTEAGSKAK